MKKELNIKTIILIVASILCLVGAYFLIRLTFKQKENDDKFQIDGIEVTKNEELLKDAKADELDITNQFLYNSNDVSVFSATIKNNTENDITIKRLYAVFTINESKEKMVLLVDRKIKTQTAIPISITFDRDVLNTTKIEYVLED